MANVSSKMQVVLESGRFPRMGKGCISWLMREKR
jgi:hypothetical protein